MRSGATSSGRARRLITAIGLLVLAGVAAGGAVLVVPRIERDLDARITRALARAGVATDVRVRVADGVYRADTLALWLTGVVAAAIVGLVVGLLVGRVRRRPHVDPDEAALLRQGWRVEAFVVPTAPADAAPPAPVPAAPPAAPSVPAPASVPVPVPGPATEPEPVRDVDIVIPVPSLLADVAPAPTRTTAAPPITASRARSVVSPAIALNDLTVISGIDAEVADLLRVHGIASWASLGDTEVGELRRILDAAGPVYRRCQPGTWPIQARLLADGDVAAWRALADGLRDGRPIWR